MHIEGEKHGPGRLKQVAGPQVSMARFHVMYASLFKQKQLLIGTIYIGGGGSLLPCSRSPGPGVLEVAWMTEEATPA